MVSLLAPRPRLMGAGFIAALVVAACGGGGASPSPSPAPTERPTPTPVAARVATAQDAATLVIATNPLFSGTTELDSEMIGQSKYWEATPLPAGGYQIKLTIGWGDCPAGCIDKHVWRFEVATDGQVKLVGEEGPQVPTDLPA